MHGCLVVWGSPYSSARHWAMVLTIIGIHVWAASNTAQAYLWLHYIASVCVRGGCSLTCSRPKRPIAGLFVPSSSPVAISPPFPMRTRPQTAQAAVGPQASETARQTLPSRLQWRPSPLKRPWLRLSGPGQLRKLQYIQYQPHIPPVPFVEAQAARRVAAQWPSTGHHRF